jgi:hypothetical protein
MHCSLTKFRGCTLGILAFGLASVTGVAAAFSSVLAAPVTPEQQSGVRRGWLPALFAPAQQDERQIAKSHLETVGVPFEGESFVQTVRMGHRPLINLFRQAGMDVNTPGKAGRTALLTAALQRDWPLFTELMQAGADINRPDEAGLTPLMAAAAADAQDALKLLLDRKADLEAKDRRGHRAIHYAVAAVAPAAVKFLLDAGAKCEGACCDHQDLLEHAFAGENWVVIEAVLAHESAPLEWRASSRSALEAALLVNDKPRVKLLVSKHTGAPTPEGRAQPLLAYLVIQDRLDAFKTLLDAGVDANSPLNTPAEKPFIDAVPMSYLKHYLGEEPGMTTLMLAAGMGKVEYVRALLEKGAKRWQGTAKYKMPAMSFAARTENADVMQLLIGDCPKPEELRIEINVAAQRATVYRNGSASISTPVSTGRAGFRTATGKFVITDKHLEHKSTIYKVPMPFFMRLNCRDFGMHQGVVPGYPASHGCIRVPDAMARKLFKEIPVGTLVTIE